MADKENPRNSDFNELRELLGQLTVDQIRFSVARQQCHTDKEAAEEIGLKPDRVYQWRHTGVPIDDAVRLLAFDGVVAAQYILRANLLKAAMVKAAGLDENDARLRQNVATELIEWNLGKAKQLFEHSGPDGGPIEIEGRIDYTVLSDEELAEHIRLVSKLRAGKEGTGGKA